MTTHELRYIFVEVASGRGRHGSFLLAFSQAFMRADAENVELLTPVALTLVHKYGLEKYMPISVRDVARDLVRSEDV